MITMCDQCHDDDYCDACKLASLEEEYRKLRDKLERIETFVEDTYIFRACRCEPSDEGGVDWTCRTCQAWYDVLYGVPPDEVGD